MLSKLLYIRVQPWKTKDSFQERRLVMKRLTQEEYSEMTKKASPGSPGIKNCIWAFVVGGTICAIGQGLLELYQAAGLELADAKTAVSVTLIGLSALLTALKVYDNIARHAGAGTLVPITGFANSVVSPAMEFKSEGFVTGVGAKMFTIAGPVLVYGICASVIYGIIYWAMGGR